MAVALRSLGSCSSLWRSTSGDRRTCLPVTRQRWSAAHAGRSSTLGVHGEQGARAPPRRYWRQRHYRRSHPLTTLVVPSTCS